MKLHKVEKDFLFYVKRVLILIPMLPILILGLVLEILNLILNLVEEISYQLSRLSNSLDNFGANVMQNYISLFSTIQRENKILIKKSRIQKIKQLHG